MDLTGHKLGKYILTERLGRGGMAQVYKAYQPSLERHVAIKILHDHLTDSADFVARFKREAKNIGRLQHPQIVRVIDFDVESDIYYIVMDYIEHGTLAAYLSSKGVLPVTDALTIIIQVAEALLYAHQQGLIHRDIKPANILFTDREHTRVLLTDFGLSCLLTDINELTVSGAMVGTPAYMSPECVLGEQCDRRTDIYSLGAVLYQMLIGAPPYKADTPYGLMFKHAYDPVPSPRAMRADLPEALETVILRALAKQADQRYQDIYAFCEDLTQIQTQLRSGIANPLLQSSSTGLNRGSGFRFGQKIWHRFQQAKPSTGISTDKIASQASMKGNQPRTSSKVSQAQSSIYDLEYDSQAASVVAKTDDAAGEGATQQSIYQSIVHHIPSKQQVPFVALCAVSLSVVSIALLTMLTVTGFGAGFVPPPPPRLVNNNPPPAFTITQQQRNGGPALPQQRLALLDNTRDGDVAPIVPVSPDERVAIVPQQERAQEPAGQPEPETEADGLILVPTSRPVDASPTVTPTTQSPSAIINPANIPSASSADSQESEGRIGLSAIIAPTNTATPLTRVEPQVIPPTPVPPTPVPPTPVPPTPVPPTPVPPTPVPPTPVPPTPVPPTPVPPTPVPTAIVIVVPPASDRVNSSALDESAADNSQSNPQNSPTTIGVTELSPPVINNDERSGDNVRDGGNSRDGNDTNRNRQNGGIQAQNDNTQTVSQTGERRSIVGNSGTDAGNPRGNNDNNDDDNGNSDNNNNDDNNRGRGKGERNGGSRGGERSNR
ncbi:MAG: serine/threonine-protein kinase [Chloroflexota bacterium]